MKRFAKHSKKYLTKRNLIIGGITLMILVVLPLSAYLNSRQNFLSNAAGAANIEPENGTIAGSSLVINDTNASGGKYVRLGTVSSTTVTVDDSTMGTGQNQFNYLGTGWNHCTNCNETNPPVTLYNQSQSWNAVTNDSVTFAFTGTQIILRGVTGPGHGIGAVSIDGGTETTVDLYSATKTGDVVMWTSPVLTNTSHTFTLRVTGTKNANSTGVVVPFDRADITTTAQTACAPASSANKPADTGLTQQFQCPAPVTGITRNVLTYGATANNSADDDTVAIKNAINAAAAGDEVYIPDGIYHLKTSGINLKTGVSIRGQSRDNTVLAGMFSTAPNSVLFAAPGVNNLTLSNFKITSVSGPVYLSGIRLGQGNMSTDNSEYQNVSRITVSNLFIEKHERFGIQLENAYQVLVDGNTIKNASALDDGGQGYGVMLAADKTNNNWIKNNTIGPVIRHAILIQYRAHHNLVENNTVQGTVSDGIDFHGEDEYSNEVRYNKVFDCPRNGTTVSPNGAGIGVGEFSGTIGTTTAHDNSGPYNWIHHNEVYNCTYGLRITNNTNNTYIEDNNFHNNITAGILADLAPLNNLYLIRNTVQFNPDGVKLYDVTNANVQGNTITNNTNFGLFTNAGTTNYTITGNTINNNGTNVSLGSTNGTFTGN